MMQGLLAKVQYISNECEDPAKKQKAKEEMKNWDDFTKLRKKVSTELRRVREEIQQRNELMGSSEMGNATTVKMGRDIRNGLKEVMGDVNSLELMQKKRLKSLKRKKLKNKKVSEAEEQEVANRAEIVALCRDHIEECRKLERQIRGTSAFESSSGANAVGDPTISQLQDIDDPQFQILLNLDDEIDEKLNNASKGVAILKEMAQEMGKEIEMQGLMINELDHKVEKVNSKIMNLNKRLKKTLEEVRKADRFCIDIILLIVVLAIGGYLYNAFRK